MELFGIRQQANLLYNYIISVPFIDNGDERFLKTITPSRKFTKKYLKDS